MRFLTGDTNESDPQMQDEEVDYLVAEFGSPTLAAANACQALAAKYTRKVDKAVGDLKLSLSQVAAGYRDQAARLFTASGGSSTNVPAVAFYAGGLSFDEKTTDDQDTDLDQVDITIGMHDNPENPQNHTQSDYGTVGSG